MFWEKQRYFKYMYGVCNGYKDVYLLNGEVVIANDIYGGIMREQVSCDVI